MSESVPVLLAVAAWIATYAIHSTILLLAAWLIARRLPDRPDVTSPIWKVAAVGGIVTASFSTAFGVHPLAGRVEVPRVAVVPAAMPSPVASPESIGPRIPMAPRVHGADGIEGVLHVRPVRPTREGADVGGATASVTAGPTPTTRWDWPQWLTAAWLVGALLGLSSVFAARLRLATVLRSRRPAPPALVRQLVLLCADVPARAMPRLFASDAIVVPFAVGVLAPAIVVPSRAATLSSAAQRTMLAHELAHVLRRDPAWRLVMVVLERVLFFQPLLRLARRQIEHDAEYLCDAWAAEQTAAPFELARCLTEIASWVEPRRSLALAPSMAEPRSILRRRVLRLVAGGPSHASPRARAVPCALAMCGLLPFVAPMVAWADTSAPPRPTIAVVAAPTSADPSVPRVVVVRPRVPATPVIAAAPESTPRSERQDRRRAARALHRAIRRAGRDERLPTADELADAMDVAPPEPPPVELVYVDDAWVAEIDREAAILGEAIVIDLEDEFDGEVEDAAEHAFEAELDAIIAEADTLAEVARAHARTHDLAAARVIEARARALRRRADARSDAMRRPHGRVRVLDRALADAPCFAPPAPPLAPLPPAFDAADRFPVTAPVAPTAP
jgi:hypothetical protein